MRILLLADIHANWPALAAIDETFDACLVLGDVVDYATQPAECIDWVRSCATECIRGNHDHSVAQRVLMRPAGRYRRIAAAMRPYHFDALSESQMSWLARLPVTRYLTLDDKRFLLVHATPRDPMDEYLMEDVEAWETRLQHVDVDFVCVGHTHVPMILQTERSTIINPGSVGQPRDGDPRAAYAIIEDGRVSFHRVAYDVDRAIQHMRDAGIDSVAVDQCEQILRNGGVGVEQNGD